MSKWISVKDRLPELFDWYLVCYRPEETLDNDDPIVLMAFFDSTQNDSGCVWIVSGEDAEDCDITHWMLLPEPPES